MLNGGHFSKLMRNGLWAECTTTATRKENLIVGAYDKVPLYKLFFDKNAKLFWNFCTFGEMAIVTRIESIQNMLNNKGLTVMFVGYAPYQ